MKYLSLVILFICVSLTILAQDSKKSHRFNVKFYNTFQYEKLENNPIFEHSGTLQYYQNKEN